MTFSSTAAEYGVPVADLFSIGTPSLLLPLVRKLEKRLPVRSTGSRAAKSANDRPVPLRKPSLREFVTFVSIALLAAVPFDIPSFAVLL